MNNAMMLVSNRDCSRTDRSRRQLCRALTRTSNHNGAGFD
jgi:hypothetical protein